jgi:2,5-diamino-6-(ribosylamino)-4(3H)-pyrimidinone 5'-phosphate reductase
MKEKPFVFINVAASADGKISDESRKQVRISCKADMKRVDMLRATSDAVMVGIGTVLSDNPKLTVKAGDLIALRMKMGKSRQPLRVVVDSRCRIPLDAEVLSSEAETLIAVSQAADEEKVRLVAKKAEVVRLGKDKVDLLALMRHLRERGVEKLMVEGGATLNYAMLKEKLVDEVSIYYGSMIIGGNLSPTVVDGESFKIPLKLKLIEWKKLGEGLLARWKVIY